MSNFSGVTFPFQKVTPSDDAIVRRAVITDGILSGCKLTYAGTGLTMEAGNLLICGRQIRHGVTETWDFGGATSGYARLVLTIDATKTSTLDAFDMVDASVEYATAEDGFYSLIQEDINASGTKYQATVCIVSLADGGINEIIQQLPAASAKGAGGLNFKVVGGLTRPVDPDENTVWVPTSLDIGGVLVSNAKPIEFDVGDIWIKTGYSSDGYLNISPDGTMIIYPAECYQFTDDAGNVSQKSAETYRAGKWHDWGTYLYKEGNQCFEITGGWVTRADTGTGSVTYADSYIRLNAPASFANAYSDKRVAISTAALVDFKYISKLSFPAGWIAQLGSGTRVRVKLADKNPDSYWNPAVSDDGSYGMSTILDLDAYLEWSGVGHQLDVSAYSGKYYVYIDIWQTSNGSNPTQINISEIKYELVGV